MSFFRIICAIVIGYAFGLFQTAYFYGKARGVDIRKVGSGNAGTTNALRNFGTKAGAIVFAGDFLKCVAAILVVRLLMAHGSIGAGRVVGPQASAAYSVTIFRFICPLRAARELPAPSQSFFCSAPLSAWRPLRSL